MALESDPPYGATVEFDVDGLGALDHDRARFDGAPANGVVEFGPGDGAADRRERRPRPLEFEFLSEAGQP